MRKLLLALAAGGLFACPPKTADDIELERRAGVRRVAEAQLASCERVARTTDERRACRPSIYPFCLDAGIEKTCGEGGPGRISPL